MRKVTSRVLFVSLLVVVAGITGCFSGGFHHGNVIDDSKVEQIEKGKTPIGDLIMWFGSPASKTMNMDGSETYMFSSMDNKYKSSPYGFLIGQETSSNSNKMKSLSVTVVNGIVQNYTYSVNNG